MSIFYEPSPDELFDGGMVEIPHSVLWSSLDAETIAETYGVAAEDVLMARQELFAQAQQQQPPPSGYWVDPGYAYPEPGYGPSRPSGTVTRPRPRPRPRRPPARRPGGVVVRPRPGRVVDYRKKSKGRPRPPARGPFQGRPTRR